MPYIITIRHDIGPDYDGGSAWVVDTRRAVATLEEARGWLIDRTAWDESIPDGSAETPRYIELREQILRLPESSGTVGPLPDGTVIEVEFVSWRKLGKLAQQPEDEHAWRRRSHQIIDLYNAREASA